MTISSPCDQNARLSAHRAAHRAPPDALLKVIRNNKNTKVYANSARVARFTRAIPRSASPASHALHEKNRLSKFHHGTKLWASQNIFAGIFNKPFLRYGHILGKTLCSGPRLRPGQASPWGHRPSSSAPCAVPMRLSRIDQHIKD
jgi:hypothetical protein